MCAIFLLNRVFPVSGTTETTVLVSLRCVEAITYINSQGTHSDYSIDFLGHLFLLNERIVSQPSSHISHQDLS